MGAGMCCHNLPWVGLRLRDVAEYGCLRSRGRIGPACGLWLTGVVGGRGRAIATIEAVEVGGVLLLLFVGLLVSAADSVEKNMMVVFMVGAAGACLGG